MAFSNQMNPDCACCGCTLLSEQLDDGFGVMQAISGAWSHANSKLTLDGTAGELRSTKKLPTSFLFTIGHDGLVDGKAVSIFTNWQDANNYLKIVLDYSSARLRVRFYQVAGGSETLLKSWTHAPLGGGPGTIPMLTSGYVCLTTNARGITELSLREVGISQGIGQYPPSWSATIPGNKPAKGKIGFKAENVAESTFSLDGLVVYKLTDDCIECGCEQCKNGTMPKAVTATIAGATAPEESANGDYDLLQMTPTSEPNRCKLSLEYRVGTNVFYVELYTSSGTSELGDDVFLVEFNYTRRPDGGTWAAAGAIKEYPAVKMDCAGVFDGLVLDLGGDAGFEDATVTFDVTEE